MAASRQQSQRWPGPVWVVVASVVVVVVVLVGSVDGARDHYEGKTVHRRRLLVDGQLQRSHHPLSQAPRWQRSDRPNIIMIMTDDQDLLLGSLKAMPKLQEKMIEQGAHFINTFVSTPMCCPSRSTILTGLYVHNHNVYTNNDNCSSPQWVRDHEPNTFATYLQNVGYKTGYFGKYLNKYNGTYTPVGWDKWIGLVRNSRFYNYTLSYGGRLQRHYDNYYNDYLTDRIANDSVAFFKRSKRLNRSKPVMMVLSVPAPHGPEDAAPQYQHMFVNNTDHRTPSWNIAPNYDKQWLLRQTSRMTPQYKIFTDLLQRRRLQTLQSVDDLIEKVLKEVDMLGELENTYILYTSDHGYHLGQFGLIKGKSLAYDFDTRVPLIIMGPGVKPGSKISNIAVNVDLAPTILDMGGVPVPSHMDGTSLLPLLKATMDMQRSDDKHFIKTVKPWRDSVLLERGKVSKKMLKIRMREERLKLMQQNQKNLLPYLPPKQQKILRQCSNRRKNFQLPCKQGQRWYCEEDRTGRTRLHKCSHANRERSYTANTVLPQGDQPQTCKCSDGSLGLRLISTPSSSSSTVTVASLPRRQRRRHRRFLRQQKRKARSRLVRQRRSAMRDTVQFGSGAGMVVSLEPPSGFDLFPRRCRILANNTVSCDQDIYRDYSQWEAHKERLDEMIKEYKKILDDLRNIRGHLLDNQPPSYLDSLEHLGNGAEDRLAIYEGRQDHSTEGESCYCENDTLPRRGLSEQAERRRQRHRRKEQKLLRRAQRQEERQQRRGQRRGKKKKSCNGRSMKCFSHDNDHWKTPPYWDLFEEEEGGDVARGCPSLRLHKRFNYPHCYKAGMECALMDDCHWKTPPFWTHGPFCFCSNANNNTYWCMRTINATSDFLYCEYITNFIAFYDMTTDPFQLHNVAKKLNYGILQQLHDQLAILKVCQGKHDCDLHNFQDSHILIDTEGNWRERTIYEDSSGEGDDYDDEDAGGDDYDDNVDRHWLEEHYDGSEDGHDYDDYGTDPDPDFF